MWMKRVQAQKTFAHDKSKTLHRRNPPHPRKPETVSPSFRSSFFVEQPSQSRKLQMGGRGRSRTQRKHFRQNRENVWKRSKSDASAEPTHGDDSSNNNKGPHTHWEPFNTQNPSFDEYYKVICYKLQQSKCQCLVVICN